MLRKKVVLSIVAGVIILVATALFIKFSILDDNESEQIIKEKSGWDTYSDTWVATDELGRTLPTYEQVGAPREDKYVGIFYFLWQHNLFYLGGTKSWGDKTADVSRILREDPTLLDKANSKQWRAATPYFWGKPLFGYYDLNYDDYVLRKHAQMLSDAGVDTLIIDMTNLTKDATFFYTWDSLLRLCEVFTEIRKEGGNTPQFTFLLRWNGLGGDYAIKKLYNDLYSKNLYSDLWFKWEGKPLLIGDKDSLDSVADKDTIDFFTWRSAHPLYTPPTEPNSWSWNSIYPNGPSYTSTNPKELVSVGVAQNWTTNVAFFSSRDADGNFIARGRSYQKGQQPLQKDPVSTEYPSKYGYNFQEGLDRALMIDPNFIFITGWNEWFMGKYSPSEFPSWAVQHPQPKAGAFCDAFTPEFSRDIEPTMDGGLGDNFYYQLASAIREFKGVRKPNPISKIMKINIDGNFDDWVSVSPEFRDDIGDKAARNAPSLEKNITYTNNTGRNDFKVMKVARDKDYLYFYVETADNISSYSDPNWMRLFIKVNESDPSWNGYNYIVNRTGITEATTTLEKCTGDWNWTTVNSDIKFSINGNKMELSIPRSSLGLEDGKKQIDIQFKWHDNMQEQGNIYEFYLNGDCAPNNRFNYHFTEKAVKNVISPVRRVSIKDIKDITN